MRRASCDLLLTIAPPVASAVATPRGSIANFDSRGKIRKWLSEIQ
jgi:hypothetical protein